MTFVLIIGIFVIFFVFRARIDAIQREIDKLSAKVDDLRRSRYFAEKQTPVVNPVPPRLIETKPPEPAPSGVVAAAPLGAVVPVPAVSPMADKQGVRPEEAAFLADTVAAVTDFPKVPFQPQVTEAEVSLSEKLGTTGFIWIGAIALALAGIFFVKYFVDRGLIGPPVRIALAIAFGVGLLLLGEWMKVRSVRISHALSASGVADLYAAFLAGHHLYGLIPASVTFAFLALTTAVAVLLSLKQGQMVAVLGLLGGFLTPVWVQTNEPRPAALFSYIMLLQIALLVVTRKKQWSALALITLAASMLWATVWVMELYQPPHAFVIAIFLMATAALFSGTSVRANAWESNEVVRAINYGAFLVCTALMAILTSKTTYATEEWIYVGILSAASFALARWKKEYIGLAFGTFGFVCMLFLVWPFSLQFSQLRFQVTLLTALLLYVGAGYTLLWNTKDRHWAAFAVAAAVVLLVIGYAFLPDSPYVRWSVVSTILAAAFLLGMIPFYRMGDALKERVPIVAAFAVGTTALLSFSIPLELDRQWLTVPFALEAGALIAIHRRLRIAVLPKLAVILASVVCMMLLFAIGIRPVWYWILYSYGISGAAFFFAARSSTDPRNERFFQWIAALSFFALILFLSGQFHHPGSLWPEMSLHENGTIAIGALAYAVVLARIGVVFEREIPAKAALLIAGIASFLIVYAGCFAQNPLWHHIPVGEQKIVNRILYVYAVPAGLMWLLSKMQQHSDSTVPEIFRLLSIVMFFCFLNLEIRQFFHGTYLYPGTTSSLENYTYSVAWIIVGVAAGAAAAALRSAFWRYLSLIVLSAAVFKVFLFDVSQLKDLYRVLSFLGLGMSLLLIAYIYQKVLKR